MTADLRHAIRDAVPKLEAIAAASSPAMGSALRRVAADLLSALGDDSGVPGPTTAQEGQEGRSGQISGVSGETVRKLAESWQGLEFLVSQEFGGPERDIWDIDTLTEDEAAQLRATCKGAEL